MADGKWHMLHGANIASEVDGDKFVCMDEINNKKVQMQNYCDKEKSCIQETLNLLTCTDSSSNTKTDRNRRKEAYKYINNMG